MPTRVVMQHKGRPASAGRFAMGFTMTELVLVIVVTGILAAVILPNFANDGEFRARGFSDEVQAAARHAQKLAVASACPVDLTITAGGYALTQLDGCNSGSAFAVRHPSRVDSDPDIGSNYAGKTPSSTTLELTAGTSPIRFYPDGHSDGGTIETGERIFNVVASTGYVHE